MGAFIFAFNYCLWHLLIHGSVLNGGEVARNRFKREDIDGTVLSFGAPYKVEMTKKTGAYFCGRLSVQVSKKAAQSDGGSIKHQNPPQLL